MAKQARLILIAMFVLMAATVIPLHWLGVDLDLESFGRAAKVVLVPLAVLGVLKTLKRAPLVQLLAEVMVCGLLFAFLSRLPTALLVRLPVPFSDSAALALDLRLGLHVGSWVHYCQRHPHVSAASFLVYNSLSYADAIAVLLPVLFRRPRWSSELFVALSVCLLLSWGVMAFSQGIGPWQVNGIAAHAQQVELTAAMFRHKSAAHVLLQTSTVSNFIAFPSFHVILAMLAAFTVARVRALRELSVVWALLVAVSTITEGWHYGVDVLSGALVASVGMLASRSLHRRWDARAESVAKSAGNASTEVRPAHPTWS